VKLRASAFWDAVCGGTAEPRLDRACMIETDQVIGWVANAFRGLCGRDREAAAPYLRAYCLGRQAWLEARVLSSPPAVGEDLNGWATRISKGGPFGVILNRAEQFSPELASWAAELMQPLVVARASGAVWFECVLFVGDYGYSPFGVHVDADDAGIIHLHLGPNGKDMILWTRDEYIRANGTDASNFDPGSIAHTGRVFRYGPGDLFYMPSGYYHVGRAENFSVTLAIVVHNATSPATHRHALAQQLVAELGARARGTGTIGESSVAAWLDCQAEMLRQRRESNGWFISEPVLISEVVGIDDLVRVADPFRMSCWKTDQLHVFARGRRLTFLAAMGSFYDDIMALVEMLNAGRAVSADAFAAERPRLDPDVVAGVLERFLRHGAIVRTRPQEENRGLTDEPTSTDG
jgi:hypothetical protein